MAPSGLGTWNNPPLAYVVAELVISPYYSLRSKMPQLQDVLREAYPRTIEAQEIVIEGGTGAPPAPQPIWRLLSADQGQGVHFGTRAVSLHATSYSDSDDFLVRWGQVLAAVDDAKLGAFVERAGVRFVDLIVPASDRPTTDYLAPGFSGVKLADAQTQSAMWSCSYTTAAGEVVNARIGAPAPGGSILPPDLIALPLQKPPIMVSAESRLQQQARTVGFIDTDCLKDVQQVFNVGQLRETFDGLQKLASRTFRALISDVARKEWM